MINELKQAFVDQVRTIKWMDDVTKKVTIEKTREMITFIGYPDWLFQQGKLDEYYDDVIIIWLLLLFSQIDIRSLYFLITSTVLRGRAHLKLFLIG